MHFTKFSFLVILILLSNLVYSTWFGLGCFKCPTSDEYEPGCLDAAIPPWPICLLKDADGWVDKAIDAADRCCGEDTSECRCPSTDSPKFQDYCDGVDLCYNDEESIDPFQEDQEESYENENPFVEME